MKRFASILLIAVPVLFACNRNKPVFNLLSPNSTGIHFNNVIAENDSINPLDLEFLYNGGGVAIGDFNNDGKPDCYFTASTVSNKMYLNEGNLKFRDVTDIAGVNGKGRWCNGATVVDINNDGLQDIYVCATIKSRAEERTNLLYVNQGNNKDGVPVFKEMASAYGLADTGYSVQAAFFDYDNDGDLDMYLVHTRLAKRTAATFNSNDNSGNASADLDKLYRNDFNDFLHHPFFTDVSEQANIKAHGFGLGIGVADMNNDGWKDVYVTNDFFSSDQFYLNNKNGTFTNSVFSSFKHTSQNAMGNDIADINNDGLPDLVAVDMNPEDNYRKKKNTNANNYFLYQNMVFGGYMIQYVRNTLQLNLGATPLEHDSTGPPMFADISYLSGVAETDWSWNPSLADFDNDGQRDLLITNGYPRDVTDHDFTAFRTELSHVVSKQQLLDEIPQIKINNYAFRNMGDLHFENVSAAWGMNTPSFSSGAAYADFDNDGDLDYIVNNINDEAFVYENTTNSPEHTNKNFLEVKFEGPANNKSGLGTKATIYYQGKQQTWENEPTRGYLSCIDNKVMFGLDTVAMIDSMVINWSPGRSQTIASVKSNQHLTVSEKNAGNSALPAGAFPLTSTFENVTTSLGIYYRHFETDFIDFNHQRLLPHKFSEYGPGIVTGDIDGNGLDDICLGASDQSPVNFLMQQADGKFTKRELPADDSLNPRKYENLGMLLFDADNDGHPDLYLSSGSSEYPAGALNYQDRLFMNDGKGNFTRAVNALPVNVTSKSCVKAVDFDHDGDLDLFVGGRVLPGRYPEAVSSFLFRNDSRPGHPMFTDVTASVAPGLMNIGLTCDASWTDIDNDGWPDLVLAGEWMPLKIFRNKKGRLEDDSPKSGIDDRYGWWNSLTAGDFDNDGDIDFIAGNLGSNSFYHGTGEYPVRIYSGDFAHNKTLVGIPSVYLNDADGNKQEFPAQTRDDIVDQLPALKKKYLTYKKFGTVPMHGLLDKKDLDSARVLHSNFCKSVYLENLGDGKFAIHDLPVEAQFAPLYGMVVEDFNNDGNLDLVTVGNDFGTEVNIGRYDAMNGLMLLGDGKGGFRPATMMESGIYVPGNARGLAAFSDKDGRYALAATQNRGLLQVFQKRVSQKSTRFQPGEVYAFIHLKNGKTRRMSPSFGSSFVSQSQNIILLTDAITSVDFVDGNGKKRVVQAH